MYIRCLPCPTSHHSSTKKNDFLYQISKLLILIFQLCFELALHLQILNYKKYYVLKIKSFRISKITKLA